MEENLKEMKDIKDDKKIDRHLMVHEELKTAEKELANMLGIVIPK
jgi:hypothetical protein